MPGPAPVPSSPGLNGAGAAEVQLSSRRQVLRTAGLVALVGGGGTALAACSSEGPAGPAPSTAPSTESSSSSSSASQPSSGAPSDTSASSKAPSGPSVTKAQVPEGGGVIMPNADYVVTQPEQGSYKAFSKKCTHQGCPVAMISNREIVCRCHGSRFSIADGSVVNGPAKAPLPEAKATVSGDMIVISS